MKDSEKNIDMLAHNDDEMAKNSNQPSVDTNEKTVALESYQADKNETAESNDIYDYRKKTQISSENMDDSKNNDIAPYMDLNNNDISENEIPLDIIATDSIESNDNAMQNNLNEAARDEINSNFQANLQTNDDTHIDEQSAQSNAKLQDSSQTMQDSITNFKEKKDSTEILFSDSTNSQKKSKKQKKRKKAKQQKYKWKYIIYSKRIITGIILVAVIAAIYTVYLLFGSTSFEVLWKLHQTRNALRVDVEQSRIYNAELQRKVLELKALEPK